MDGWLAGCRWLLPGRCFDLSRPLLGADAAGAAGGLRQAAAAERCGGHGGGCAPGAGPQDWLLVYALSDATAARRREGA